MLAAPLKRHHNFVLTMVWVNSCQAEREVKMFISGGVSATHISHVMCPQEDDLTIASGHEPYTFLYHSNTFFTACMWDLQRVGGRPIPD